jgi:hypothetical protein
MLPLFFDYCSIAIEANSPIDKTFSQKRIKARVRLRAWPLDVVHLLPFADHLPLRERISKSHI